jgi:pyrroline-5-carboxylate reductase
MKKIVFFGAGNIAQSIILGLISSGHDKENILFIDRNRKK